MPVLLQNLWEAFRLLIVGMAFVLFCLWMLSQIFALIGRQFERYDKAQAPKAPTATQPPFAPGASIPASLPTLFWSGRAPQAPSEDENITLVIAAAIDRILEGQKFRVLYIKPLPPSDWAREGRTSIFGARRVR